MQIHLNHKDIDLATINFKLWKSEFENKPWMISVINFLEKFADSSPVIEIQTSGSTGKPKLISAKKEYLINSAKATCNFFGLNKNSVALLCMNTNYIGAQMMLVRAIVCQIKLVVIEPQANSVKNLNQKIDFCAMVPYQVEKSLQTPKKFNLIKNLIIGGGKSSIELQKKLFKTSVNCYETFGMTETYSHIALRQLSPESEDYFTCLKNVGVSQSDTNQLIINAPELGVKNLATNDLIKTTDSSHFTWIGRLDYVINSGGIKISPEPIENKIRHLLSSDFCIVGLPHYEFGEQISLIIESKPFDTSNLENCIKEILPKYHQPKQILFTTPFPKTETGKIKRLELKYQFI